ncbi:MAG TPA: hypothetical protein VG078_11715 [Acidimicrobiales bacterium]|nr:hypothetical protein [Acidimicrobiales bacterium]
MRRPVVVMGLVALVAALSGACSGGGSRPAAPPPTEPPPATIAWELSGGEVHAVRPPAPGLPDDVRAKVTATLERYLADAVVGPLRSGQPAGDLGVVFTAPALGRVNGPDRAALVDEGLPRATALRSEAATARLGALAGDDHAVTVVAAAVTLRLHTGGADSVAIVRTGDLVLVADGDGWKIDGYDIRTTRDSAEGGATTTTARG